MSKLIVYFSYTGNTKMIAHRNIVYDAGDYRTRELITSLDEIDNWINSL